MSASRALLLLLVAACLTACGAKRENAAERTVSAMYEAIDRGDYTAAASLYDAKAIGQHLLSEQWAAQLREMHAQWGPRRDMKVTASTVRTYADGDLYVALAYQVAYANEAVTEEFSVHRDRDAQRHEIWRIVGHRWFLPGPDALPGGKRGAA